MKQQPTLTKLIDRTNAYQLGFLRFCSYATGSAREMSGHRNVAVLTERLDWVVQKLDMLPEPAPGLRHLFWEGPKGPSGDVFVIAEPKRNHLMAAGALLGLADSEAWAFGRLQTRTLADGVTVADRMNRWRDRGSPDEELFVPDDGDAITRAEIESLAVYWKRWVEWVAHKRLILLREDGI